MENSPSNILKALKAPSTESLAKLTPAKRNWVEQELRRTHAEAVRNCAEIAESVESDIESLLSQQCAARLVRATALAAKAAALYCDSVVAQSLLWARTERG